MIFRDFVNDTLLKLSWMSRNFYRNETWRRREQDG
jgi:hypothetical protein